MCPMPSVAVAIAHIADGEFKLMLLMLFRWWWLLLGSSKDSHRIPRVCVCVNVLCLVSFHFRFTFSLFALLLPAFIVELYSCRFHFILLYFTFFILSNLHFSPGCGLFFWQGWFPLTYINTYMNVCRTCDGVSYAPDFDPFPGGWDLRRLATHPSAVTLGKVSCK